MKNENSCRHGKLRITWLLLFLSGCVLPQAQAVVTNSPPPFLGSNANYNINACSSNRMVQISITNTISPADDNLVWSHSGRYIATDRTDPTATNQIDHPRGPKYICVLDVGNMGNIQTIGARSSAHTNPVLANISDWTWDDKRILFGFWPTNIGAKCRIMSCSATGAMNVVEFLRDTNVNPMHVFSPSVIYDPIAQKERLLFLTSRSTADPALWTSTVNVWTVTYDIGGVPNWTNKVALTAFTTNSTISAVRWCPELGTNYQPLLNRYAIVKNAGAAAKEMVVFTGVRDILGQTNTLVTNLADPRLSYRESSASGGSMVSWTGDGNNLMYCKGVTSVLYTVQAQGTNLIPRVFTTPPEFNSQSKQWLCINQVGTRVAFTVNKQIYMLPMEFSNPAVTNAGTTNMLSDGGYTRVLIPANALQSNVSFSITEPNSIDTNQFSGTYMSGAREFSADGWTNQYDFATNVEMYLQYTASELPTNVSPTNLSMYLYNSTNIGAGGSTGTWTKLSSMVDTNNAYVISTNITHFSTYALGNGAPPAAPTNVSASQGTYSNLVRVTWSASSGASGYKVWTNSAGDTSSAAVAVSGVSATNWDDTTGGVSAITYYWVQATNDDGAGELSSPAATGWRYGDSSISILGTNGVDVVTNGAAASADKGTDFGIQTVSGASLTNTFSITNNGSVALQINSVTTNGAGAAYFTVSGIPDVVSGAGAASNFTVVFNHSVAGLYTAVVTIANNSSNTPYRMNFRGTSGGEIGLSTNALAFAGTYGGSGSTTNTFTITNLNQIGFNFTNAVTYSSGASGWLSVSPAIGSVAGDGAQVVTGIVSLASLNAGVHTATNAVTSTNAWTSPQSVVVTLTMSKANQTITNFPNPGAQLTTNTVHLSAQASSELAVTNFAVLSGPGMISGLTTLTFTNSGTVKVTASQAGNTNWNAAANVTNSFTVTKASQTINFPQIADQVATSTVSLSATAGSGLSVSFAVVGSGPGEISGGSTLTFTGAGSVGVIASQAGNAMWNAAPNVTNTLSVSKATQTITFAPIADQVVTSTLTLSATAGSGLTVSFTASGPAAISAGNILSFSDTGSVSVVASQAGNAIWSVAPNMTNAFNVIAAVVTNLGTPQNVTASDGTYTGKVTVTWSAVTGANGYEIFGSAVNSLGTASILARPTTINYDDTSSGVCAGLMRYYWLRAWNTAATGSFSAVESGYAKPSLDAEIISGQPAVGDYDGDGMADPAVFHLNSGRLYAWFSSAHYSLVEPAVSFFVTAGELPVTGDFDGDAYADPAVFHPQNGTWYIWLSSIGYSRVGPVSLGVNANDIPIPADYDGDRKTDPAVYQASTGGWYVWLSSAGYIKFGPFPFYQSSADIPVPGQFDVGLLADPAVYQQASGAWYIWLSNLGYMRIGPVTLSTTDDHLPVPADYDGDGLCDPASYVPALGKWRIWMSGDNYALIELELK